MNIATLSVKNASSHKLRVDVYTLSGNLTDPLFAWVDLNKGEFCDFDVTFQDPPANPPAPRIGKDTPKPFPTQARVDAHRGKQGLPFYNWYRLVVRKHSEAERKKPTIFASIIVPVPWSQGADDTQLTITDDHWERSVTTWRTAGASALFGGGVADYGDRYPSEDRA